MPGYIVSSSQRIKTVSDFSETLLWFVCLHRSIHTCSQSTAQTVDPAPPSATCTPFCYQHVSIFLVPSFLCHHPILAADLTSHWQPPDPTISSGLVPIWIFGSPDWVRCPCYWIILLHSDACWSWGSGQTVHSLPVLVLLLSYKLLLQPSPLSSSIRGFSSTSCFFQFSQSTQHAFL